MNAKKQAYSVSQINAYITNLFDQDYLLRNLAVKGEVSGCKYHPSGHIYFSLKDEKGTLSCVMFAGKRAGLRFRMEDGQKVVVSGYIGIYEARGSYQLYASEIELEGEGALYEQFLKRKAMMEEKGMFDAMYKQPIPRYAMTVGIVTASSGAVINDICRVAREKNPYVRLLLAPTSVQGEQAAGEIAEAIRRMEQMAPDVIIVGRGGGSIEDLWAFNEEEVANAIFECSIPVISAVGHESDYTIADFVADARAGTPSIAADMAVFSYPDFVKEQAYLRRRMDAALAGRVAAIRDRHNQYKLRLRLMSPERLCDKKRQRLIAAGDALRAMMEERVKDARSRSDAVKEQMERAMGQSLDRTNLRYKLLLERLRGLSPLQKLERGYAYVSIGDRALTSTNQVRTDDEVLIHVTDGVVHTAVKKTESIDRS